MSLEHLQLVLSDFGKAVGIEELALDENGYCCLKFDDTVVNVEASAESGQLFLYTNLGEIPPEKREAFYEMLLEANFFYKLTAGGVIGIDKDANIVSLAYQTPCAGLESRRFEKMLENFISVAETWSQKLKEFQAAPDSGGRSLPNGMRA